MSLLDDIPGYREAVERESASRAEAFTDAMEIVCGVELLPLTPRRLLVLEAIRSPFAVGGPIAPRDVALFLWSMSPEYAAAFKVRQRLHPWAPGVADTIQAFAMRRFLRRVRKLVFSDAVEAIQAFLESAMQDGPSYTKHEWKPSYYSPVAGTVLTFAERCHWSEREILDTPFSRLFQYARHMQAMSDYRAIFFNPSDKVRSQWLRECAHAN